MRKPRNIYTVEEDICIAEALLDCGFVLKGRGVKKLRACLGEVRNEFMTRTAKFGIDGSLRSSRSLEARFYVLKDAFKERRLHKHSDWDNPLLEQRHDTLLRVFGGRRPSRAQPSSAVQVPQGQRLAPRTHEAGRMSVDRKPRIPRHPHEGIQKQKHNNATRLLNTLNVLQRNRTAIEKKREETMRMLQEMDQRRRKWNIDQFKKVLESSSSRDDVDCSDILGTLEDLTTRDAKLCMIREENARDRVENDRENNEWERSLFNDLMDKLFD